MGPPVAAGSSCAPVAQSCHDSSSQDKRYTLTTMRMGQRCCHFGWLCEPPGALTVQNEQDARETHAPILALEPGRNPAGHDDRQS